MRGICRTCLSSNVEIEFDIDLKGTCVTCKDKDTKTTTELAKRIILQKQEEIRHLLEKYPELKGETHHVL